MSSVETEARDTEAQAVARSSLPVGYDKRLMVSAGRASGELGAKIADKLGVGLTDAGLKTFSDGEVYCRYEESDPRRRHLHRPVDLRDRAGRADGQRRADGAAASWSRPLSAPPPTG